MKNVKNYNLHISWTLLLRFTIRSASTDMNVWISPSENFDLSAKLTWRHWERETFCKLYNMISCLNHIDTEDCTLYENKNGSKLQREQINKIFMEYDATDDCTRKEICSCMHTPLHKCYEMHFSVQLLYEKYLPIDNCHNTRSQLQSELCKTKWILCVKKWSAPLRYNTKKFFTQTKWINFCHSTVSIHECNNLHY